MEKKYNTPLAVSLLATLVLVSACDGGAGGTGSSEPGQPAAAVGGGGQGVSSLAITGSPQASVGVGSLYEFTPDVTGASGANATFSIENQPAWASFDSSTGVLSGTPVFTDVGHHNDIVISASDGSSPQALDSFSIMVTMDEVELAIATGDASPISSARVLEDALLETIEASAQLHSDAYNQIFNLQADGSVRTDGTSLTSVNWNPTHDASMLVSTFGENRSLLFTNAVTTTSRDVETHAIAVVGEADARYMVMGGNPMRNYLRDSDSVNEEMHQVMENSLAWLTARSDLKSAPFNVVIAQLDQSQYFPDENATRAWLDERFPDQVNYNDHDACDEAELAGCLTANTDLLIVSQVIADDDDEVIVAALVKNAMSQSIPVLYMHHDGGHTRLGKALFPLFDVTYRLDNYWRRLSLADYSPTQYNEGLSEDVASVKTMMTHFRDDSFTVDWSACDEENCNVNESLNTQFWSGAKFAQQTMRGLDAKKQNIFTIQNKYRFNKLLALVGDYYRGQAMFPMDRLTTPTAKFLRAFYGDHAVYQYRPQVGVWSNMGNFSRTDFSHVTPVTRVIEHVSKENFRSTGAYALPGQTVTATRNDASDVKVTVYVNSIRNGATHTFADNGYKRPQFLKAQSMEIAQGETIQFTSPTGGPIHLSYNTNDLPVEVAFTNIGEHAHWRSETDNDTFNQRLYANEFDWAEMAAPSFEVHSTQEKMIKSMANKMFGADGGTPQELVDATMRYVHNFPHVLAGFQGPGIDVVDEIHQFASDNGLAVANLDRVKHMNADQATCGYGCSGNPYDAYWSFSPIGHGDIHELGHGLERSRFRLTGWPGHASTNFYSYYTKTQYFKDTGEDPSCQSLPFEASFDVLQASLSAPDPAAYIQENLWTDVGWSTGTAMVIQMMMAAEDNGVLVDGWHLLARLHILEREYQTATRNDDNWLAKRSALGMDQYDRTTARSMSPEDWLLIMVSKATGLDFRDYFDAWAHAYTDAAAQQVAAMSLPMMQPYYYVSSGRGFCQGQGFDGNKLPLDGSTQVWPLTD